MAPSERPADRGRREGRRAVRLLGEELRLGRIAASLSQAELGRLAGMSHSKVSRIERDEYRSLELVEIAVLLAIVGRQLSARAYPHGSPERDSAQRRLLEGLRVELHPSLGWATEVPLPNPGDSRAWDAVIRGGQERAGVEAETRPTDGQDLQRRLALKRRDGGVDEVILLLSDTRSNRLFLRATGDDLRRDLPVPGHRILEDLRIGRMPRGSGIVLLPLHRTSEDAARQRAVQSLTRLRRSVV